MGKVLLDSREELKLRLVLEELTLYLGGKLFVMEDELEVRSRVIDGYEDDDEIEEFGK